MLHQYLIIVLASLSILSAAPSSALAAEDPNTAEQECNDSEHCTQEEDSNTTKFKLKTLLDLIEALIQDLKRATDLLNLIMADKDNANPDGNDLADENRIDPHEDDWFVEVSSGDDYTCGLLNTGAVKCWGDDRYGRATPLSGAFTSISAGHRHACGIRDNGRLECWGHRQSAAAPTGAFTQVSAGFDYSCAIRKTTGTLACWGPRLMNSRGPGGPPSGAFKQTGVGYEYACAIRQTGEITCWGQIHEKKVVPPAGLFTSISIGNYHGCGRRSDGAFICWGSNADERSTPPFKDFTQMSAGSNHTCGIRIDGSVACWGYNRWKQATAPDGVFTQVSAGLSHTCGVNDIGKAICWGDNLYTSPTSPPSGRFSQLSVNAATSHFLTRGCALDDSGEITCWGYVGRPGYDPPPPTGVFTQVRIGEYQNCVIRTGGQLFCWNIGSSREPAPPAGTFHASQRRKPFRLRDRKHRHLGLLDQLAS